MSQIELIKPDPGEPHAIEETGIAGVYRTRRLSVFERWQREGKIEPRHLNAANIFNIEFYNACLTDNYATMQFGRIPSGSVPERARQIADARKRIAEACRAVGQIGASWLWDYVGLEKPLKAAPDRREAVGTLRIVLDLLAAHYRL